MRSSWLTTDDLAELLQVHPRTVQRWARERRIPHVKLGTRTRFTPDQVAEIENAYHVEPERRVEVDIPNPHYREQAVVVPMRRPPAA